MSTKNQASVRHNGQPKGFSCVEYECDQDENEPNLLSAIESNIRESLDEIDILRGTIQYWESRRAPAGPDERNMLSEAFRIMHGELLGLTARMKELLDRVELAPGV